MLVDAIVAGAGLWGCTIARRLVDSVDAEAAQNGGKLIVGGRLGEYRYYDMDKSIAAALAVLLRSEALDSWRSRGTSRPVVEMVEYAI